MRREGGVMRGGGGAICTAFAVCASACMMCVCLCKCMCVYGQAVELFLLLCALYTCYIF